MSESFFGRIFKASKHFSWVIAVIVIAGCNDGGSGTATSQSLGADTTSAASALNISGTPPSQAVANQLYSFAPQVAASSGSTYSFSIQNKPSWATFSTVTGSLSGSPSASDVGTDANIVISVSNPKTTAALAAFAIAISAVAPSSSNTGSANSATTGAGGTTLVFSYPNGFATADSAMFEKNGFTVLGNGAYQLTDGTSKHEATVVWYGTQLNITSFTTEFTFQNQSVGGVPADGMVFVIQNMTASEIAPGGVWGLENFGDANGLGFFTYQDNCQCYTYGNRFPQSVAIKFDTSGDNGASYLGASPETTGLYLSGGPGANSGVIPQQDFVATGINMYLGDILDAYVTYDGSTMTMVLTDTTTGAKARYEWPVDISAVCNCTTAWVGMSAGNVRAVTSPATQQTFNSWTWYSGYNPELAAPTFSVASGQYASAQRVTISGPSGASIYYTTDGQEPTSASSLYSSAITVSSTEVVKAVAVESGHTDSTVSTNYYQISGSATYPIDFSGGFSGSSGLINAVGDSSVNGSALDILDGAQKEAVGAAWNISPVNISSFTTNFTLQYANAANSPSAGTVFVIQNVLPAADDLTAPQVPTSGCGGVVPCGSSVTGGPLALGGDNGINPSYMGWYGLGASVGVKFDLSNNSTALLKDGESTGDSSIPISGVTLASGDPIDVRLSYDGTTLTESITDATTKANFVTSYPMVNIPSVVGASTAYVGFVGASGYDNDVQQITAWNMN